MSYPKIPDFKQLTEELTLYAQLKSEYGAKGVSEPLTKAAKALRSALTELKRLPIDPALAKQEPDDLEQIRALRPPGPRRMWNTFDKQVYRDRLEGALLGRMAGCILGAPVEFWSIDKMKALADDNGDEFPPTDYWSGVPDPQEKRYQMSRRAEYTRSGMKGVPVDDDLIYTLLGLLIAEEHGPDFSIADVGRTWLKYLPYACTAEDVALKNLMKGIPASRAGATNNPYCEWIGASIRADPWGYLAPGWPERAAAMAYADAYISHRRQGIYGEMFFASAIAAAFAEDDPVRALRIGLTEIPKNCAFAKAVRWALRVSPDIKDYRQARIAMDEKFKGMHPTHAINNACLTIWGITIGGKDLTRVIGETVAMGMDNDCTAATAGSIVGAVIGKKNIPEHWYRSFDNTIHSYLIAKKRFSIAGVLRRFEKQAAIVHSQPPDPS
ncbi:MAG TPA: ADP-ribosylglycohydrolase family protein [bacterium]|nr:ADP-ribosylglycohydrolase family protein [bacterium]HPG47167.1 ADP-ribosylglycohydrolase family protein [bacterium]HPM99494.1 ADP-ribosylglycohydrolase family protein [bacterium]